MIEPLYELLGLGVCVILITHQRKAEGEYGLRVRGGTALTGSADVIVEVERPPQSAGLSSTARVVKIVSRFAGAPDEIAVELDEEGWRSLGTVKAAARRSKREEILALLGEEPLTFEEILERAAGLSKNTVRRRLGELVEHGLAERLGDGKRSDPHRWKLSEAGRTFLPTPESGLGRNAGNPSIQAESLFHPALPLGGRVNGKKHRRGAREPAFRLAEVRRTAPSRAPRRLPVRRTDPPHWCPKHRIAVPQTKRIPAAWIELSDGSWRHVDAQTIRLTGICLPCRGGLFEQLAAEYVNHTKEEIMHNSTCPEPGAIHVLGQLDLFNVEEEELDRLAAIHDEMQTEEEASGDAA